MDLLIDSLFRERATVLILDPNHIIKKWNSALSEFYGWSASEVIGKNAHQLLQTVFPGPFDEIEGQFLEKLEWRGQLTQTKKDGSQITVTSHWIPLPDQQGRLLAILEFIQDISKYIEAQEALRESEAKYRDLFENSVVPMSQALPDGRLIIANAAYARMYGYDNSQEMMVEVPSVAELYADLKDREEILQILREKDVCEPREIIVKRRDGKLLYVLASARAIRDSKGNLICYQAEHIDITELKQAEEKLRQAEHFTQATIDALPSHICVLDENGTIIFVNQAWRDFADANDRTDSKYYIGSNYLKVCDSADGIDSEGASDFGEGIRRVLRHELDQYSLEYSCDSPRENRWFIANVSRFKGEKLERLVISHVNITERKQFEIALRESRERLSRLSYHLVETQEQERRRVARELHDEIGQTLTALTISLNGISRTSLDAATAKKIDDLKALTSELMNQVNSLSSELRPRVLDDLGLVPGLVSLFNRLSIQTGIEVDFKHGLLEPKRITPEIEITAYRIIQQALSNVIRHAAVKLAIVRIQIDENTLWIQVQDEGKGFEYPSAMLSGTAMGLTSMLERAELVGGELSIQTAPGEGTIITCRLPLSEGFVERRKYGRD